jgi:hypothetical protein
MWFKRRNKMKADKYSFVFSLSYTTAKGITIETPKVHITILEISEEKAKQRVQKIISKKVVINLLQSKKILSLNPETITDKNKQQ